MMSYFNLDTMHQLKLVAMRQNQLQINDVDEDYAIQRKHMFEKICLQNNSVVFQNALWIWR